MIKSELVGRPELDGLDLMTGSTCADLACSLPKFISCHMGQSENANGSLHPEASIPSSDIQRNALYAQPA
jgi:hypothetical protein